MSGVLETTECTIRVERTGNFYGVNGRELCLSLSCNGLHISAWLTQKEWKWVMRELKKQGHNAFGLKRKPKPKKLTGKFKRYAKKG